MIRIFTISLLTLITFAVGAQDHKREAETAFFAKDWNMVIHHYEKYLASEPDSLAQFRVGYAYHQLKNFEQAAAELTLAKQMGYYALQVDYYLAKGAVQLGNEKEAMDLLVQAVKDGLWTYGQLLSDAAFDPIREHSQFDDMLALVKKNAFPCLTDEKYQKLDFWIGEWDVYVQGNKVGENIISKAEGGCAIHEDYTTVPGGFAGQSISFYDPIDKKWRQSWVGNSGSSVSKFIELDSGNNMLQFMDSTNRGPSGEKKMLRMTFTYLKAFDAVKQFIEVSTNEGRTWSPSFHGLYVKKGTPYPTDYDN